MDDEDHRGFEKTRAEASLPFRAHPAPVIAMHIQGLYSQLDDPFND
jgi:hypothetical protein